ncbi:PAS domain-containing protein [Bacteroidota bacterium]
MNLNNISIRTRFYLLLVCSVLFWLFAGFLILSLITEISRYQDTSNEIRSIPQKILRFENAMHTFYNNDLRSESFHESGRADGINLFNSTYLDTYSLLRDLKNEPILSGEMMIQQKLDHLMEYLISIDDYMGTLAEKSRERGWQSYGLSGVILKQMEEFDDISPLLDPSGRELFAELQYYLEFPGSSRLNSLQNSIQYLGPLLQEVPANQMGSTQETNSLTVFLNNLHSLLQLDLELGITQFEGLQNRIYRTINVLNEEANALAQLFSIKREARIRNIKWGITLIILLTASIYGLVMSLFSRSVTHHLRSLRDSTAELVTGRFPEGIIQKSKNEFSEISGLLNKFSESLKNKAGFASDLAEGKDAKPLEALSPDDSLSNSLTRLEKNLQAAQREEDRHQISREERRWTNEGIAKFSDILRIHNNDISALSENVIQELVNYLNASTGGFFLLDDDSEEPGLELIASFAYDRKKYLQNRFKPGEGLVGTCAIEKEKIFLSEIPDDYIKIASGLGEGKPKCLLLMPLKLEDVTLGVIELASLRIFANYEIEFVENLAESIASAVSTVQMNMRTTRLLEQSQQQAREMAKQEEIMRQNMEELQTTQDESARRESEISGILNGIHNSAHVAEFNMNEEMISINDKFLRLLESQRTQLLGKKYHEIVGVSRHTDDHRKFWQEIKDGKTVSRIDKVSLFTGQDIWLRQTFTPILDKEGNPFKVLIIAADITETVEQKEALEKQSNEITRANIEMKSFSDAVDRAFIKCVYSPAGQILELNENFEHITGYTEKEMLGKNNRVFLQRVEKEQFDKVWEDILKDKPYSGVIRRTKPTGEEVWIMSTFTPVKDENGNIFKVFFLGQDITERKLKYQLLEEANREIDRLRKQQGEQN